MPSCPFMEHRSIGGNKNNLKIPQRQSFLWFTSVLVCSFCKSSPKPRVLTLFLVTYVPYIAL